MKSARLERIRTLQRRARDAAEADANAALARNAAQRDRLVSLASAMAPTTGALGGRALATASEFVARLNTGLRAVDRDAAPLSAAARDAAHEAIAARRAEKSAARLAANDGRDAAANAARRDRRNAIHRKDIAR